MFPSPSAPPLQLSASQATGQGRRPSGSPVFLRERLPMPCRGPAGFSVVTEFNDPTVTEAGPVCSPQLAPLTTDSCLANAGLRNHDAHKGKVKNHWLRQGSSLRHRLVIVSWNYAYHIFKNPAAALLRRGDYGLPRTGSCCPPGLRMVTCAVARSIKSSWLDDSEGFSEEQDRRESMLLHFEMSVKWSFQLESPSHIFFFFFNFWIKLVSWISVRGNGYHPPKYLFTGCVLLSIYYVLCLCWAWTRAKSLSVRQWLHFCRVKCSKVLPL